MLWLSPAALPIALLSLLSGQAYAVAAPLSIAPAGNWEGVDGTWSTYAVRVGTPDTVVRLFVSTTGYQTWVIAPQGCSSLSRQACDNNRGNDFYYNQSSTWQEQGEYQLWIEQNLGLDGRTDIGEFGLDTVSLGYDGEGGPTLQKQVVGAIATEDYHYGLFGINPVPTNWSNFSNPSPSYMTSLKQEGLIPSISWAYTGGAQYRFSQILSSLTLGGYDSSRYIPNNLTILLCSDNDRALLVVIQNITTVGNNLPTTELIPAGFSSSIYASIDSTVAEFWLPQEICTVFENTFNLTYDSHTSLYLVSDMLHTQLLLINPNITFTLGSQPIGGQTVDITLPYSAFDLTASPPYSGLKNQSLYFPLRRAANSTQYRLGKTFLQEAYLIVDWERQNFSISQCLWEAQPSTKLVPITPFNCSPNNFSGTKLSSSRPESLNIPAVVGTAIGAAIALSLSLFAVYFLCWRRRRKVQKRDDEDTRPESIESDNSQLVQKDQVFPKAELDADQNPNSDTKNGTFYKPPLRDSPGESTFDSVELLPVEADSKQKEIFEMPGDFPKIPEAGGRQITEKEALRKREEKYNGVDTHSPTLAVNAIKSRRPAPVNPEDVHEIINRVGPRSERGLPISPVDGNSDSQPMSPVSNEPTQSVTPSTERRRFSYED